MALGRKKVEEVAPKGELQVLEGRLAEVNVLLDELNDKKIAIAEQHTIAISAVDTVRANELQLQHESLKMQTQRLSDERYQLNYKIDGIKFKINAAQKAYTGIQQQIINLDAQREQLIANHEQALARIGEDIAKEQWELSVIKAELEELGGEV